MSQLFTSESVTAGHPDKVADHVSDGILDAVLAQDRNGRVAVETLVTTDFVLIAGELTTTAKIDAEAIARETIRQIGYTHSEIGFDYRSAQIVSKLHSQSPDIAQGVDVGGAGDQGLMFGFATRETPSFLPLPIHLAHRLVEKLTEVRESGEIGWLRPDGKSQVTVEYKDSRPVRVHTIVLSTQHDQSAVDPRTNRISEQARRTLIERVIRPTLPQELWNDQITFHINPTGLFLVGGPHGDTGLTGRKIIVDTYGGRGRHGGGAFSGKDPSKVDRSAAYVARYIAKNLVAAGLADVIEVQLAYAIGVAEPVSVHVNSEGTGKLPDEKLAQLVREHFPLTPRGIIDHLELKRPIYRATAALGHFGRQPQGGLFTWEKTDKAIELAKHLPASARASAQVN
ncbi:MAG TPA: methionine adenosyltransferase [Polyangiaceae bacterium]|nr:methionine adenosyltransferase [Polyangiaceae bacterium]